jgi:hypothetical protein
VEASGSGGLGCTTILSTAAVWREKGRKGKGKTEEEERDEVATDVWGVSVLDRQPLAPSNEFLSIAQGCGPVESSSESLADQRTRRRMVAADAFVDLLQDVLAFFSGNALHEYSRSGTLPVELVAD